MSFLLWQHDKHRGKWIQGTDCLAHLRLRHQATHNAQQLSQGLGGLLLNAHPIDASLRSNSGKLVEESAGRGEISRVSGQPWASHRRRPARRAVEVVSQRSVSCARWKEADYFLAMVHWLCRLAKNEDVFHWANELGCCIKAKMFFFSSKVSPPPEVGPSIWVL